MPQLDTRQGLAALRGNVSKYVALLRQFSEHHAGDAVQLRQELANSQFDAAKQRLHTLKGVASNLGAVAIQTAAAALEQALHNQTPVSGLTAMVGRLAVEPANT